MDTISKEKRSLNMVAMTSKNTSPEKKVRKILFSLGFRYRLHSKKLPGKPDIVLKTYNTVIFINGCFWHQHKNCKRATIPKTNKAYWIPKLKRNIERDKINRDKLKKGGWKVAIIWECQVKDTEKLYRIINNLFKS